MTNQTSTQIANDPTVFINTEGNFDPTVAEFVSLLADTPISAKYKEVQAVEVNADDLNAGRYISFGAFIRPKSGLWNLPTYIAKKDNDGKPVAILETTRLLRPGDFIITNPLAFEGAVQNCYAMAGDTFRKKYEPTDRPGTYRPKGLARLVPNPTGEVITYLASWGELQTGQPDCFLCCAVNPNDINDLSGEVYIVSAKDAEAYAPVELVYGPNWEQVIRTI